MSLPLLLGVEIGGTKLQLGLGHGDGRLLAIVRHDIEPAEGARGILAKIAASTGPLRTQAGLIHVPIDAVGIGFGGPVDVGRGIVTTSHQVAGWDGFPLAEWVRELLEVALVSIQNDADTAGLGESRFGAGIGLSPLLYVTIGSGIGGGLIVDGRIYRGAGAGALEIGHLWIEPAHLAGEPRTLESLASGWAIGKAGRDSVEREVVDPCQGGPMRRLADDNPARVTAAVVSAAARLGDSHAIEILDRATQALARGLAHAVTLLAPRRIILGGGVSLIGEDLWFQPIRRELDRLVFPPFRATFDLVPASLGETVVVHGALALARDALNA